MALSLVFLVVFLTMFLVASVRIVPEYERLVVFRLGRVLHAPKGPGITLIIPLIDRAVKVDLRETVLEIPEQSCITQDNAAITIDFLVYLRVINPVDSLVNIENYRVATTGLATTTLRAVIGDIDLDSVLSRREEINRRLQEKLDEVTQRWGIKVTAVEIREITPPAEIQDAMTKQMAAERTRRAMITEADGMKQSEILKAEGEKQAKILRAEGEKQSRILTAEGFATALERIFQVAKEVDRNTLVIQYLETLKEVGTSPSTKIVIPFSVEETLQRLTRGVSEQGR